MCGIAGIFDLAGHPVPRIAERLTIMSDLIAHRGPDGKGIWIAAGESVGLAHRRLSIIDLSDAAGQPMISEAGTAISYNGEIYNYPELRAELGAGWHFRTRSDTETILAAYARYGKDVVDHLRGMFAFAIWDGKRLFCARDRFGIKPLYYAIVDGALYLASEIKALLPFLPEIATDEEAFGEYVTFQYTIGNKTLFRHVKQLLPGHTLVAESGRIEIARYWDVHYAIDYDHSPSYFVRRLHELIEDSVAVHLRSDVPVGSYLSGGIDSSLVAILAARHEAGAKKGFHGKFTCFPGYDESGFAHNVAGASHTSLYEVDITADDFCNNIRKVIYHLDHPVAGPGSFPQYMVSRLAREQVKVVLGGQGGDEIFGGYARYLIAYFEQCIKAAIDGSYRSGNFVVTAESIIPNLTVLQEYTPLIRQFWSQGLFGPLDERYFRLIDRSADTGDEIDWEGLDKRAVFAAFQQIFNSERNVRKEALFDSMTHFDFKCLLPALLQVEDRMSMAHGLESRVPFLDHPLIEFAASVPADVKFKDGRMKNLLKTAFESELPQAVLNRRDKMGFPVPLKEWLGGELRGMLNDTFRSAAARSRPHINYHAVLKAVDNVDRYSRKLWGLLSLELWYQTFHDQGSRYRAMVDAAFVDPQPKRITA